MKVAVVHDRLDADTVMAMGPAVRHFCRLTDLRVVSEGSGDAANTAKGFIERCMGEKTTPDLLVLHASNPEVRLEVEGGVAEGPDGDQPVTWPGVERETALLYAARLVCENGGRCVVVSGGDQNREWAGRTLANADLSPHLWACCPCDDELGCIDWDKVNELHDFAAGVSVSTVLTGGDGNADEMLCALSILSQGYAAAAARCGDGSWEPPELVDVLDLMGWQSFVKKGGLNELGADPSTQRDRVQQAEWWLEALGAREEVETAARQEWGEKPGWEPVGQLLEELKPGATVTPATVGTAFIALHRWFCSSE